MSEQDSGVVNLSNQSVKNIKSMFEQGNKTSNTKPAEIPSAKPLVTAEKKAANSWIKVKSEDEPRRNTMDPRAMMAAANGEEFKNVINKFNQQAKKNQEDEFADLKQRKENAKKIVRRVKKPVDPDQPENGQEEYEEVEEDEFPESHDDIHEDESALYRYFNGIGIIIYV